MKLRETLVLVLAVTVVFSVFSTAGAASIPSWVKGVAGWWSQDKISEQEFLQGIDYLISSGAIKPKIIDEKDAKIKELEAKLAEYEKQPPVQTNSELRESTKQWTAKQITDQVYFDQIQKLGNAGKISKWFTLSDCIDAFCSMSIDELSAADKKLRLDQFKKLAAAWLNGETVDDNFIQYLKVASIIVKSDKPNTVVAPTQKTESQKIYDEQIAKKAALETSHTKLMDNAKQWYYGYISTETYLENIVSFEKQGVFDPFKTPSQQLRGDVFFTEKAIQNILKNDNSMVGLKMATEQFINTQITTSYFSDLINVFYFSSN